MRLCLRFLVLHHCSLPFSPPPPPLPSPPLLPPPLPQLILLIDVFASDPSSNMTTGGCAALGGLLQFTAIFQFVWILALVSRVYAPVARLPPTSL